MGAVGAGAPLKFYNNNVFVISAHHTKLLPQHLSPLIKKMSFYTYAIPLTS